MEGWKDEGEARKRQRALGVGSSKVRGRFMR
jgi:hypothetical protein